MTVTLDPPVGTACAPDLVSDPVAVEVRVLDAGAVLAEVVALRRIAEAPEARVYTDPDEGGPPGQTRPDKLACLCRRHHRLETLNGWD